MLTVSIYSTLYVNVSPADKHLALYISLENNTHAKYSWIFSGKYVYINHHCKWCKNTTLETILTIFVLVLYVC